jgi:outer membrane protein TolC
MRGKYQMARLRFPPTWIAGALVLLAGCHAAPRSAVDADMAHYMDASTRIDYPDVEPCGDDHLAEIASTPAPFTLASETPTEFWDLTLQEAVQLALQNSTVLRDLGGSILQAPDSVPSIHGPAIQESDPRFGVEGALSAFDAAWSTQAFFSKNDRALNNILLGGGTRLLQQDLLNYRSEIAKRSAVGTQMAARHNVEYDFNNAPGNNVPNLPWSQNFEVELRQSLLQGGGVDFNRIAGPNAVPGVYSGVLIARIGTDLSLADFEAGMRDFVNDVETAYWELYFAYRDLDAKMAARDRALNTWREVETLRATGRRGSEFGRESRAREQYLRLAGETQNALTGRLQESSRPTTFRGAGGIHQNERRLRAMMGVPVTDRRLIRPSTEPTMANIRFAWEEILGEGLMRRVELRRQLWKIKRRELELIAAKNYLLPQLDVFGRYRWRGLGHDLIEPNGTGRPPFHDATQNLFDGDFQEWQLGVEMAMPIGFRRANAGVRNAEWNLARERAVLESQQRQVALDISQAVAEKDRAYALAQTNYNRRIAALEQLRAVESAKDNLEGSQVQLLDFLLDAQRRLAEADIDYHRSLVEYAMAIKQVHYAKGSLLEYNEIFLTEGPWPGNAWCDALDRSRRRMWTANNFALSQPPLSQGAYAQEFVPDAEHFPDLLPVELQAGPPTVRVEEPPTPPAADTGGAVPGDAP